MASPQEVEDHYYREVGTFIDLVCQRQIQMSCAKIILVATKADGELSLPLQPDVLASIIEKARNHLSYLYSLRLEPVVFLFHEVLVTSSKIASRDQLYSLHTVIEAMVRGVKPLDKIPIPKCWFTWLQKLRENPSVLITDLPNLRDRQGPPVNITVGEIKQLEKLRDLLAETTPTTPTTPKTHDLLKRESPTVENQDSIEVMHPKVRRVYHGQLPSVENEKEEVNQGPQIPQELAAPIRFFTEMTEILWYSDLPQLTNSRNSKELRNQIITEPMHLIRALRSLLNHNVKENFDKTKPTSRRHYEDLTQKGKISFDVFEKIYRGRQFTAAEVWGFLFQLDIACPLDDKGSVAFIPSLISNEMEEEFKERLAGIKKSGSSLCVQYTFERAKVGIFYIYKLLSNFAKAHKIGTTGGRIESAFMQKIEKREMAITAGVSGRVKYSSQDEEQELNFLLHEFESTVDPLGGKKSRCAHPVHKGIRIHLQQKEGNTPTKKVLQFMKRVDENISNLLIDVDVDVRLVCPTCLSTNQTTSNDEGCFNMGSQLQLDDPLTVKCSTSKHTLPDRFRQVFIPDDKSPPVSSAGDLENAKSTQRAGWGARSGAEDDRVDLNEIISAELIKTGNHGDCFAKSEYVNLML